MPSGCARIPTSSIFITTSRPIVPVLSKRHHPVGSKKFIRGPSPIHAAS